MLPMGGFHMIRVGAVNIDTSHPMGFADAMAKSDRMRYVGVYNDSFRPDAEVDGFIGRYGLEKRCGTIDELARMCDIGFVQGCDWDDHLRCAAPFIARGKPVFLDKPMVGRLSDCDKIKKLADAGAVILGSSSARYAYEIQRFLAAPERERGRVIHAFCTSGVDEFNYGIHAAEAVGGLMGQGAAWVRHMGRSGRGGIYTESLHIGFEDGRSASLLLCTGVWQPFALTAMTIKNTYQIMIDSGRLYEALIEQICDRMEGKPNILAGVDALVESVKIMLAAAASRARDGEAVRLDALTDADPAYDGRAFWERYGAASGRMYAQ